MSDVAYNAGLEIRYAIATSGVDPIQHIPEVDAIIERRLAEARRQAFIEAAEIARAYPDREPFVGKAHRGVMISTGQELAGEEISSALRAKAEEIAS